MRQYSCTEAPIQIHGLYSAYLPDRFWRLPEELFAHVNEGVVRRSKSPVGGRVRFRTDSPRVTVRTILRNNDVDWAIPLSGSAGSEVYIGWGRNIRYAGIVAPRNYEERTAALTFEKERLLEEITIYLPRNVELEDVLIELEDDSVLEAPRPYTIERPIVFYGSSITEGGCATRPANAYTALIGRWLDADTINLGFSGSARGEPAMAEYIANLEMSAFVLDYDHNAPTVEHLEQTHEPFFKMIRKKQPELPILMLTKPDFDLNPEDAARRREVVRRTYDHARDSGDRNVYFIDGETFFGKDDREACTIEGCHPNDLGFMRMAQTIYPVLKEIVRA